MHQPPFDVEYSDICYSENGAKIFVIWPLEFHFMFYLFYSALAPFEKVIAKGDEREVGHTISDPSQYLACITCINRFSASIKLKTSGCC